MDPLLNSLLPFISGAGALLVAFVLAWIIRRGITRFLRHIPHFEELSRRGTAPLWMVLSVIGLRMAFASTAQEFAWYAPVDFLLVVVLIGLCAWLASVLLLIIEAVLLEKYATTASDNRRMGRLKTQIMLARRVGLALIITVAIASVLLTIDEVRALGAGILASAGLISIVAGLAVQSSLSNVFAGVQLAFTDAIRVDDVVFVEEQMGTIEEITMTYVVVRVWDERRLILPSTYFTSTPFENWTRRQSELLGTVDFDLDWTAPIEGMRAALHRFVEDSPLWDRRLVSLQVTAATEGLVRVRVLVSAANSSQLWDLRCLLREKMVMFLQSDYPDTLPRQRWETIAETTPRPEG